MDAYPTREGVFSYKNTDGSERRELRLPEEVYSPDSLASLRAAPVTDMHPSEPVNPDNWQALSVGHVAENVRAEKPFVAATLLIQDAKMIAAVEKGERRELSCGYECSLDETPGTFQGQHYDAIQRGIKYNHVALGPKGWGRAGPQVALRLDEKDAPIAMKIIRIDGTDYEAGSDPHLAKIDAMLAADKETVKALSVKAETCEARAFKAETEAASERLRADGLADPKAFAARVNARVAVLAQAQNTLGERFDAAAAEGMGDIEMMGEMLKIMDPAFSSEGKSEDAG